MELFMEIVRILLPIVLVGGFALFVVLRMKHKHKKGMLGQKKSEDAQVLLGSLIPFGIMMGFAVTVLLSLFTPISLLSTITWEPGMGLSFGYIAYEFYSKTEESQS